MNATSATIAAQAEATIRRLREVEGVSVSADGQEIREIHVLTSSPRPPKNLVRDIQTVLKAGLGLTIDHRVVSIARAQAPGAPAAAAAPPAVEPAPAAAPAPLPIDDDVPAATADRIRFESVNLFVSGPRTQAQVELRWRGMPRMGNSSGWGSRDDAHRLVAQATAGAVQEFLFEPVALNVVGAEIVAVGRVRVALVSMALLAHRQEKVLTGSCAIEHDTEQAVVLATLDALNRVVGGMRVKEPTEYVLRPTSV